LCTHGARSSRFENESWGPLQDIRRELRSKQEGKCFVCAGSLEVPGKPRIRYKVSPWELAASDLPAEEICRRVNDEDYLIVIHKRCWRGTREMQKLLGRRETIPASASLNARIRSTDTNTLEVKALHPIEAAVWDPLKNP
jgi:hypothetical protein